MSHELFDVNYLIKHFLCCAPISTLDLIISKQNVSYINLDRQKEILQSTVNSNLIKKYPVKQSYQRAFLKFLMNKIEDNGGEIHEDMYITYCSLISAMSDESIHYRHFLLEDKESTDCISLQESTNMISEGTTGLCIWQGALELGKWCVENRNEFCEKIILELGCGIGLTGLFIIKKCFPNEYIFTDCHKTVLDMVSKNVKFNLLQNGKALHDKRYSKSDRLIFDVEYNNTHVKVMKLKWEDINEYINEYHVVPDIIIGADILYEANAFYELVLGLKTFLSFKNRYAIIAGIIRNVDTMLHFQHHLELHDLTFEECNVPERTLHIQATNSPIKILKIFKT